MAGRVRAAVMALGLPDGSFDAAISVFGIILFPDADVGMRELARVLKPSARAAIVTWTETEPSSQRDCWEPSPRCAGRSLRRHRCRHSCAIATNRLSTSYSPIPVSS